VEHEVDKKAVIGDRESTKEILNLEQQLKAQAGENKKFYPSQGSHAMPQVDGLSDAVAAENSGEPVNANEGDAKNILAKEEAEMKEMPAADDSVDNQIMDNNHEDDEAELRQAAMMDQSRDILDDDILELLRENPDLWDQVVSGKLY